MSKIATDIARQLFKCAAEASNSENKRAHFIHLPAIIQNQAAAIAEGRYQPQPFTVFAVTDPKLREIFAPSFIDRLVQQWLVRHIEPWWDKRFIDDSYANRTGKGTQAAIERLQRFMRQPGRRWFCQLDIRAFFPSIDRRILQALWQDALPQLPWPVGTRKRLHQVAIAILTQSPVNPPPLKSGDRTLLKKIPPHKSLLGAPPDVGLPIGSLTSQFFANVYLNELDQFIKHTLKVRAYVRYVDDFVMLADDPQTLLVWKSKIEYFLRERLRLELHPGKVVLQRSNQGIDFLGSIVFPGHSLVRQRSVRALRRRLAWFKWLVFRHTEHSLSQAPTGSWQRWLSEHRALNAHGQPTMALLTRMLSTINSYYGVFGHANSWRLRKHIFQNELGPLKTYFLPDGSNYRYLKIRKAWFPTPTRRLTQRHTRRSRRSDKDVAPRNNAYNT